MDGKSCCAPAAERTEANFRAPEIHSGHPKAKNAGTREGMVRLEGGDFLMGSESDASWAADAEGPVRTVALSPFWIARTCVTNAEFAEFVAATGYETEAERFGWSFVFFNQIPKAHQRQHAQALASVNGLEWWVKVEKADWQKPGGPGTNIRKLSDHPVVHLSWSDAANYAEWRGARLPTEAEWEFAARGGLEQAVYPWGDELVPDGKHRCNIWQGTFPQNDTAEDGYAGTAPAKSFRANGYGLYNVAGNVWEWASDWWSTPRWTDDAVDPTGPTSGTRRVIRGGSYLCHHSYCNRYRVGARSSNTPDSSTGHTGFRLAMDA